jgi:hypothetical protein
MHMLRNQRPPRFRLWCDWLLLAAGLVALLVPLELVADAAYRSDQSVLYWWLLAYSYLDGAPAATVIGFAVLALALLAYWISLRLLLRAGLATRQTLALVVLTILTSSSAAFTLVLAYVLSAAGPLASGTVTVGGGLLTAALLLGLRAEVSTSRERAGAPGTPRMSGMSWTMLGRLAPTVVATLLAVTVAPFALLIGERSNSYNHLASASFQEHRYYLAREQTPSEGSLVLLYRCDAFGVWCHQIDALGTSVAGQSDSGRLQYDATTQTLTAHEGGHRLLTYPAGDLFAGP